MNQKKSDVRSSALSQSLGIQSGLITGASLHPVDRLIFPWRIPCPQKILVVTDGYVGNFLNGSFSHYYFGLSAFIDTMLDQNDYFVRFNLTLAHRQTDDQKPGPADPNFARYAPNFENFRFTTGAQDVKTNVPFNINHYDQIWLFGVRNDDSERLNDDELRLLTDWMENGGGLFATGDHAELGAGLCARVPRASKMRLWTNNTVDGTGATVSPPSPIGVNRHDTLVKGHDSEYTFDDESDDIPMRTFPKYYYSWSFSPFLRYKYPHPVLCGKDGVINILPDHPHEGEILPSNRVKINDNLYNGNPEFRQYLGNDYRPEIIASAQVQPDHTAISDSNKGDANAKIFGAIGAYDGYKTDVGRVVVDSTWHHWFDVNLIGRPVSNLNTPPFNATNPKTQGFLATPAGQQAYSRIQNYFVNVGLWLAPKNDRLCMLNGLLWHFTIQYPAVERIPIKTPILQLGLMARDALGRKAGQCNLRDWIFQVFPHEIERIFIDFDKKELGNHMLLPTRDMLEVYAFGGAVQQLLQLAYEIQDKRPEDKKAQLHVQNAVPELVSKGFTEGFDIMLKDMKENLNSLQESMKVFGSVDIAKSLSDKRKR